MRMILKMATIVAILLHIYLFLYLAKTDGVNWKDFLALLTNCIFAGGIIYLLKKQRYERK